MKFNCIENELLVLLARSFIEPANRQRIEEILSQKIKWEYFFERADYHDIYPLIYTNLQHFHVQKIKDLEHKNLSDLYIARVVQIMALTKEVISVLLALQAGNILAVPLKGPVLAQLTYGDVTLRACADIDILVPQDQVEHAKQILTEIGYQFIPAPVHRDLRSIVQVHHHEQFVKNGLIHLELHRTLEPSYFSIGNADKLFWKSVKPISCFNLAIQMPSNEEMFLYLCRHGSRHLWLKLKWLCDMAQYLRTYQGLDWGYIFQRAERSHTKRMLLVALYLAGQLFDSPLSQLVIDEIAKASGIEQSAAQICELIFVSGDSVLTSERSLKKQFQLTRLHESWPQRLRFGLNSLPRYLLVSDKDRAIIDLPSRLSFFYYVVRMFRLLGVFGILLKQYVIKYIKVR